MQWDPIGQELPRWSRAETGPQRRYDNHDPEDNDDDDIEYRDDDYDDDEYDDVHDDDDREHGKHDDNVLMITVVVVRFALLMTMSLVTKMMKRRQRQ